MVALISRYTLQATGKTITCIAAVGVQTNRYLRQSRLPPQIIENPITIPLKEDTDGRSSNRIVTLFGATGFVGRYLCYQLAKIGTQLVLPYRTDGQPRLYCDENLAIKAQFNKFDLRDDTSIRKCIKYSDVVINLIGNDVENIEFNFRELNIEGPRRIARICKEANIKHFIHMSALNVGDHLESFRFTNNSPFLHTKWKGEYAVRKEFPKATIIRSSIIWGLKNRFCLYDSIEDIYGKAVKETEKQPVAVCDVAKGITAIVKDPENTAGKTYQFVGPKRYKLFEYMALDRTCNPFDDDCKRLNWKHVSFHENAYRSGVRVRCRIKDYFRNDLFRIQVMSDKVSDKLPTLADLGIALTPIE